MSTGKIRGLLLIGMIILGLIEVGDRLMALFALQRGKTSPDGFD